MIFLYIYINFILEYNIGKKYGILLLNSLLDTWQFVYEIVAIRDEYLWHSILTAASSFILKS